MVLTRKGGKEEGAAASLTTVLDKSRRVPGTEGGPSGQRLACLAEHNAFSFFIQKEK